MSNDYGCSPHGFVLRFGLHLSEEELTLAGGSLAGCSTEERLTMTSVYLHFRSERRAGSDAPVWQDRPKALEW